MRQIMRAVVSVSDKTGLPELGRFLARHSIEIVASRGSAKVLLEAGVRVRPVEELTSTAELAGGRVKTLHHLLHAGILALRDPPDQQSAQQSPTDQDIPLIDLVVVNLYPFEQAIQEYPENGIESIDIGGSALIRAAAKNHAYVTVVTQPALYPHLMNEMAYGKGMVSDEFRAHLAQQSFAYTAAYDAAIASWFSQRAGVIFPEQITFAARRQQVLRYGENPHQPAALYAWNNPPATPVNDRNPDLGLARARQIQGRQISYNNLNDANAAWALVNEFKAPAVAIVKHTNPCGVAQQDTVLQAWLRALECDRESVFGGVVASNQPVDDHTASELAEQFIEVLVAPAIDDAALDILKSKRNLRILLVDQLPGDGARQSSPALHLCSISGGLLVQSAQISEPAQWCDSLTSSKLPQGWTVVTKRQPTPHELDDLLFAWQVVKYVKSNAIVLASRKASVGIGAGQMSRVAAVECAVRHSAGQSKPSSTIVVASDAFFPFADGLIKAHQAGAAAAVQPGGSVRDHQVIAAADERSMAMIFTRKRHFRH